MAINYQKLWDILTTQGIAPSELREAAGITTNAMAKLGRNESVQLDVLAKICCVLNCTLNEILEFHYETEFSSFLPDVDFSSFITANQYSTLGITKITDFSPPRTATSLKNELIEFYVTSKLSMEACEELIASLEEKGIYIDFPKEISPNIEFIPEEFSSFECNAYAEETIEHQQIHNYIEWTVSVKAKKEEDFFENIALASHLTPKSIIEHGYIDFKTGEYVGTSMTAQFAKDAFPVNLLCAIFVTKSCYILASRLPDIKAQINEILETLLPSEVFWLRLVYQYGCTGAQILNTLGLPCYDTLLWGVQNNRTLRKALRKLRHPSRSKNIRDYYKLDPFVISNSSISVYYEWVSNIEKNVASSLDRGAHLAEALSDFYTSDIIDALLKIENKWKGVPEISIDEMDLSWKSYVALEQAGITSLRQLWDAHGKQVALADSENTNLRFIAGLGASQVAELLAKMAEHELLPVESNCVSDIVDYAEKLASDNKKTPSIACIGIPHQVLRKFLEMKYRRLDAIMADYMAENIEINQGESGKDIYDTLQKLAARQFPVVHFSNSEFWDGILIKNPNYTFEGIREAYILDKPLKCNPNELQEHISGLFPTEPLSFKIMHCTRSRTIHWIAWPINLFTRAVKKHTFSSSAEVSISKAYYAIGDHIDGNRWIAVEAWKDNTKEIHFFRLEIDSGLIPINEINPIARNSIFQAIEFNAALLSKTPCLEERIPRLFVTAQKDFCEFYSSKSCGQEEQQFFCDFEPLIFRPSTNEPIISTNITIEELDLSVRAYNCLKRAGVNTVNEILQRSCKELMQIRNMSRKALVDTLSKLKSQGIPLNDDQKMLLSQAGGENS